MAPTPSLLMAHTPALSSGRWRTRHPIARATVIAGLAVGSTTAFCLGAWAGVGWVLSHHVF
ncbi:hypothetical protein GCM10022215_26870 [Nocardioides fonticola]|uniref:Uncharacterized protein n=2 Tax=Nocardioides fonticola TaxID=450363 RepID=A0ABP7XLS5_9ACTN